MHRQAIEARARTLVMEGRWAIDEVVLAMALDQSLAERVDRGWLDALGATSPQPLLQARLAALGVRVEDNPHLHAALRPVLSARAELRQKIFGHLGRLAALLAKLPLLLPTEGWHPAEP